MACHFPELMLLQNPSSGAQKVSLPSLLSLSIWETDRRVQSDPQLPILSLTLEHSFNIIIDAQKKREKKKKMSTRMSPCLPRRHAEPKPLCRSLVPPLLDGTLTCTRSDFPSGYNIHLLTSHPPEPRRAGDFLFHLLLSVGGWLSPLHTSRTQRRAEGCGVPGGRAPRDQNCWRILQNTREVPGMCSGSVPGTGTLSRARLCASPWVCAPESSQPSRGGRQARRRPASSQDEQRGGDGPRTQKRCRVEPSGVLKALSDLTTLELRSEGGGG